MEYLSCAASIEKRALRLARPGARPVAGRPGARPGARPVVSLFSATIRATVPGRCPSRLHAGSGGHHMEIHRHLI